jgi:hypothetical protein
MNVSAQISIFQNGRSPYSLLHGFDIAQFTTDRNLGLTQNPKFGVISLYSGRGVASHGLPGFSPAPLSCSPAPF